jgi:predicted porin
MKKALFGTTALAAMIAASGPAAAQGGRIKLGLSGYYKSAVSYVRESDDGLAAGQDYNPVNVRQDSEIHFGGETTLDNGISVGFKTVLKAITDTADQMGEHNMWFEGAFGRVEIGSDDDASDTMEYFAPQAAYGVNSPTFFIFAPVGAAPTGGYINQSGDANKVMYYTPRVDGFQFGASYAPNMHDKNGDKQSSGLATTNGSDEMKDVVSVGANFIRTLGGVDVVVSGGYAGATWEDNTDNKNLDDQRQWGYGVNLGYRGVTVGTSYARRYNQSVTNPTYDYESFYDAGVEYATGPWAVSVGYSHGVQTYKNGGEDRRCIYGLDGNYTVSPGLHALATLQYMRESNDSANNVDGWGLVVGTTVTF